MFKSNWRQIQVREKALFYLNVPKTVFYISFLCDIITIFLSSCSYETANGISAESTGTYRQVGEAGGVVSICLLWTNLHKSLIIINWLISMPIYEDNAQTRMLPLSWYFIW